MRTATDVTTKRVAPMEPRSPYGMELVIDLHDCDRFNLSKRAASSSTRSMTSAGFISIFSHVRNLMFTLL